MRSQFLCGPVAQFSELLPEPVTLEVAVLNGILIDRILEVPNGEIVGQDREVLHVADATIPPAVIANETDAIAKPHGSRLWQVMEPIAWDPADSVAHVADVAAVVVVVAENEVDGYIEARTEELEPIRQAGGIRDVAADQHRRCPGPAHARAEPLDLRQFDGIEMKIRCPHELHGHFISSWSTRRSIPESSPRCARERCGTSTPRRRNP